MLYPNIEFFIFIVNKNVLYKRFYIPVIWNSVRESFYGNTQTDFGRMVKVDSKTLTRLVADDK